MQAHDDSKGRFAQGNEKIGLAGGGPRSARVIGNRMLSLILGAPSEWNDRFSLGHVLLQLTKSNLAKGADKVLSQQDKVMSITDTVKAQKLFEEAFPLWRYGSAKAAIREAYAFCKKRVVKEFTYRRARSLKEGAARRVDGEELDALREALIEEQKREAKELRTRLAALDEILARHDA